MAIATADRQPQPTGAALGESSSSRQPCEGDLPAAAYRIDDNDPMFARLPGSGDAVIADITFALDDNQIIVNLIVC